MGVFWKYFGRLLGGKIIGQLKKTTRKNNGKIQKQVFSRVPLFNWEFLYFPFASFQRAGGINRGVLLRWASPDNTCFPIASERHFTTIQIVTKSHASRGNQRTSPRIYQDQSSTTNAESMDIGSRRQSFKTMRIHEHQKTEARKKYIT